jgi:PHS family inorganic phosphate transporter-like MFS transporter
MGHEDTNPDYLKQKKFLSSLITSIGNFSIQYNFQSIAIALIVMSSTVCTLNDDGKCKEGEQEAWVKSTASAVVFAGAVCGQLSMGYAGDIFGRNAALIFTLSLVSISALLSAVAAVGPSSSIYTVIIIARFFLGFGAGGVYPLSATKAAEDAGHGDHVDVIAASYSFFWQVPGSMVRTLVPSFCLFSNLLPCLLLP